MNKHSVRDWMSQAPVTITADATLNDAQIMMQRRKIRHLPVLDGQKLAGIVTLSDIRGAEANPATSLNVWELNYLLSRLTVAEIMQTEPVTINPDDSIREAARLLLKYKISSLPVVAGNGNLVGILTESDIFRLVAEHWPAE